MKPDIFVKIEYNLKFPKKTKITTNARDKDAVLEILEGFVAANMGQGQDDSPAKEKNKYEIVVGLDLSDDTFGVQSDTGNKGLTCGIIMDVINKMDDMEIKN